MSENRQFKTLSTADLVALQSVVEKQMAFNERLNRLFGNDPLCFGTTYSNKI